METTQRPTGGFGVFTDVQEELRSSAKRLLEERSPASRVREVMETETGYDEALWQQIADLGWLGIHIPEEYGGIGYGFVEVSVLLEEMGRRLLCAPFLSSAILGGYAILNAGTEQQKQELLPGIVAGTTRATLGITEPSGQWDLDGVRATAKPDGDSYVLEGTKAYVLDGHTANLLVVAARTPGDKVALFLVDPESEGVSRTPLQTLDMTRKQANIELSGARGTLLGSEDGAEALQKTLDQAAIALSVEMVGGAQECLDMAVEYAKERFQFGRPIGSFQAIKHKCADILLKVEMSRSAAYYASWSVAEDSDELGEVAPLTKAYAGESFFHAAAENIQIHGGIGFTWEHDAHLYFRRAKSSELYLGDTNYHRQLLADRLGV